MGIRSVGVRRWRSCAARRNVALVSALVFVAGVLNAAPAMAHGAANGRLWSPFDIPATKSVSGKDYATPAAKKAATAKSHVAKSPVWPAPASSTVSLAPIVGGHANAHAPAAAKAPVAPFAATRVAGQPVTLAPSTKNPTKTPGAFRVTTVSHAQAAAAGIDGVLVSLARADGQRSEGSVGLELSYGTFAEAFGGGYASRLRLVELPACALTTPAVPACRAQRPIPASVDYANQTLAADISLPASSSTSKAAGSAAPSSAASGQVVIAETSSSSPAGADGNYAASTLNPAGQWSGGTGSGAFTYNIPIALPPALGGTAPSLALSYDSQGVDGKTSMQNAQASWVGDGWNLEPGSIAWSYKPCSKDGLTSLANSGDECWGGNVASISLGSHSGQLVRDDAAGKWHLSGDDGTQVEHLTGSSNASNGTYDGSSWRVTTPDGTQYYFGQNHLPGGDKTDPATNSAWTVPVYCPQTKDVCYSSTTGTGSWKQMAFQWNLDYVVDPNGNLTEYFYTPETNYYSRGAGQNNGSGTLTQYDRGGYLSSIAYGFRLSDQIASKGATTPAAKVQFTPSERCLTNSTFTNCAYSNLSSATASHWPDVPYDQNCNSTGTCTNNGPTFWTTKRLTSIQTQVMASGAWQNVDQWTLAQSLPSTGNADGMSTAVLELDSIQRTGQDTLGGGYAVPLPAETFKYTEMDNRVDGLVPAAPPLYRPRLSSIQTETGGSVAITYQAVACSRVNKTMPASADSNAMPCFPVTWTPQGQATSINDWFQKILVHQVTETDQVTGDPTKVTTYQYVGGAAWHRDDNPLTDSSTRTWDQWRGYGQVITRTGASPDPITESETTFLRGMNGDYLANGSQRSATVSTWAGNITDANQLNGLEVESQVYTRDGGSVVSDAVNIPWIPAAATATQVFTGLPSFQAWQAGTAKSFVRTMLSSGAWRTTETDNTFDPAFGGRLVSADNKGDTSLVGTASSQEVCTLTSYAASNGYPNLWIYPDEKTTVDGSCTAAPSAANTVSDARSYYDQPANGANLGTFGTVTHGNLTGIANLDHYDSAGVPQYTPVSASTFDAYGRPITQTNLITGAATTTTPTPATGAEPTSVTATGPVSGWSTTTTLDPARNVALTKTDVNGNITTMTYDGLGRITQLWKPGWSQSAHPTKPSQIFSYYVYQAGSGTTPNYTETQVINELQTYSVDYKILDGFGNERQEQTSPAISAGGDRTVSDVWYDSHGWVAKSDAPYYNTQGVPSSTLLTVADNQIPNETVTTYDGQGRATVSQFVSYGVNQWATATAYPGADETDTTAPAGGTGYSTFNDARGNTVKRIDYNGNTPTGSGLTTTYTYTPDGRPLTITDAGSSNAPSGATWTYSYDAYGSDGGHTSTVTDPDTGTTTTVVDNDGNTVKTTDGRGQVLSYAYDLLGRRAAEYNGATQNAATELASWTYDSAPGGKNQLASSTRYQTVGSTTYSYVDSADGYTAAGAPTGETVTIPAIGSTTQDKLAGSYDTTFGYTSVTGMLDHTDYPAAGGLAAETVYNSYTTTGLLSYVGGNNDYTSFVQYSPTGQVQRTTLGDTPKQAVQTYTYDTSTGRIIGINDNVQNQTAAADAITYTYNPAGNLTSARDLQNGANTDLQCYQYDGYQRLTQVWTDPGTQTSTQGANTVDGIGGCTATAPTEGNQGTGPAPYWQTYTYDNTGNKLTEVDHDTTGPASKDVTRTSSYANPGQANWPVHGLASVTSVGPSGTGQNTYKYDAAGNMTNRVLSTGDSETLSWDPEGHLSQDVTSGGTVNYLYDASGSTLIRGDTGQHQSTLYLPGQEVYLNTSTQTLTASRFMPGPGGAMVIEQSNGAIWYEFSDPQGTATLDVNASTLATSRREFTAWGAPRGTSPTSWPDDHTFLGKATDATTDLVDLGARQYDPTTGRFISVDPILETSDPRQMGGYTYAGDNPSTHSDPSGLMREPPDSGGGDDSFAQSLEDRQVDSCGSGMCMMSVLRRWQDPVYSATQENNAINRAYAVGVAREKADAARRAQQHHHWWQSAASFVYHASGLSDIVDCATNPSVGSCVNAAITVVTLVGTGGESAVADIAIHAAEDVGEDAAQQVVKDGVEDAVSDAAGEGAEAAGAQTATDGAASAAEDAGPASSKAAESGGHTDSDPSAGSGKDAGSGGSSGASCANSFPAGTSVLTTSGIVPIQDLHVGDQVVNAQPGGAKTEIHAVTAVHVTYTDHDYTELTLAPASADATPEAAIGPSAHSAALADAPAPATNHKAGTATETPTSPGARPGQASERITSTSGHLYWDVTTGAWTEAGQLKVGDRLQQPGGTVAVITATTSWTTGPTDTPLTYNLTVADQHTYYVTTGAAPVLVHNCGGGLAPYDADFAMGQLTRNGTAKASELEEFGGRQGWIRSQTENGPAKFTDENGVIRLTIKRGSDRAAGSADPHVEMRNALGERIDSFGNVVSRKSPGNHTPIIWDLP